MKRWVVTAGFAAALITGVLALGHQSVWAADSCSAPATNYGTVSMSVPSLPAGTYTIWTHMKIPSSSANSVLLNVGGTCYNVGGSTSIPANAWEWINYYDGRNTNVVQQSLGQGTQSVKITGQSSGVRVDQIEFVLGSCVPSGTGGNCVSSGGSTGGSTGGGGTATGGTRSSSGGGNVSVLGQNGTLTPTDTGTPTQVGGSVTLQPGTSAGDAIIEVQYYLNNKLLAAVTTPPFSYHLDTKKILNGTYTLTTKTTYASGNATSTSQKLIVKNPFSFTQLMLMARHYIVVEIILLIVLIVAFRLLRKWLRSRRPPADSLPPAAGSGGGGTPYIPLSYNNSPYPVPTGTPGNPAPLPQLPVPPVVGEGTPRQQY